MSPDASSRSFFDDLPRDECAADDRRRITRSARRSRPQAAHRSNPRSDERQMRPGIAPLRNLYGHFVEHLGGVVYDGIWVGERSRIANTAGMRQALVDHMRRLPKACDPLARRLLRRQLRLARRRRPARRTAAANQLLGRRHGQASRRPVEVRHEPVRHQRVRAVRAAVRGPALPRGQPAQPARARLLPVGRVLQLARGIDDAGRPARQGRRRRAAAGAVLGRRERELGLRRQPDRRGVRGRVPQVHGVGAALRPGAVVHRIRAPTAATWAGRVASSRT